MTSPTFPDGLPFPIQGDFPDVALQARELAMRVDQAARDADAALAALYKPRAFVWRLTAATGMTNGLSTAWAGSSWTADWDTSQGPSAPGGAWIQSLSEPLSWWLLGAEMMVTNVSGTPNTGDHIEGFFSWQGADPLTLLPTGNPNVAFVLKQENNAGGESMTFVTVQPLYHAQVSPWYGIFGPGTPVRQIAANSRFWGVRLGPVAL